jgi:glutaredoxin
LNVQVLGISIDHIPALQAWAESLGGVTYPLLSDFWPHGEIAQKYGVLRPEGYTERAIFIIDKEGIIQYIDIHDIDEQPDNKILFAELERLDPEAAKRAREQSPAPIHEDLPRGGVVMYCNKWCPACRRARTWFENNNIDYTEVDVTRFAKAAQQVREWTGGNLTTPTFDVDGTIVVDYDVQRLHELLLE